MFVGLLIREVARSTGRRSLDPAKMVMTVHSKEPVFVAVIVLRVLKPTHRIGPGDAEKADCCLDHFLTGWEELADQLLTRYTYRFYCVACMTSFWWQAKARSRPVRHQFHLVPHHDLADHSFG